ncbi:MAG: hydantoinase B/oxoprolinase family protein [Gammaproteobacteria bacterium]
MGLDSVCWVVNRSHQSDIGGGAHGTNNAEATEIWQEGIRITPIRVCAQRVIRYDLLYMLDANVRHTLDFRGDLTAMIGSVRVGEQRVLALLDESGTDTVLADVEAVLDGAERHARACIATWRTLQYHRDLPEYYVSCSSALS